MVELIQHKPSDQDTLAALRAALIDLQDSASRTTILIEETQKMIRTAEQIETVLIC